MSYALDIPPLMTVEEFLVWDAPDGRTWQLVDGEAQAMAPASRTHGVIQARLSQMLGNHLDATGGRCSVINAPGLVPRIRSATNFRIPDLGVTCTPYAQEEHAVAGVILAIEILSPSNQRETWTNIWSYTTIPSLREILIVQSSRIGAVLLRRQDDGAWPGEPMTVDSGDFTLESIDLTIRLIDLYRGTRLAPPPSSSGP